MEDPLLELPEELGSKCLLDCSVVAPLRRLCTSCNANISIHEQCADLLFSKQGYVDCKYPCTARYSLEFSRLGDFSQRPRGVLRCCRPGYDAGILRYALSTMNGLSLLCALLASLLLLLFTAYYGTMHNFVMPVHTVFQVALLVLMNGSSTHLFHYVTVFRSISIAKQYVLLEMVVLSATYTISAMSVLFIYNVESSVEFVWINTMLFVLTIVLLFTIYKNTNMYSRQSDFRIDFKRNDFTLP